MVKKILAILFLMVGGLITLAILVQTPVYIQTIASIGQAHSGYEIGRVIGFLLGIFLIICIDFVFIFFGIRWLIKKPTP